MRLTEKQIEKRLLAKVNNDFDAFIDKLINGGRDTIVNHINELSTKYDMLFEFENFHPLSGKGLKVIANRKHPLIYLYEEWKKAGDKIESDMHWAIVDIAERDVERLEAQKSEPER